MRKEVKIRETNNGFLIEFTGKDNGKGKNGLYVYRYLDDLVCIKEVGEFLTDRRLKVQEE